MPEILELKKSFGKFTALNSLSMNITDNSCLLYTSAVYQFKHLI